VSRVPNDPGVERAFEAARREEIAQIVDGELVILPRPARPQTRVASRLA
jgi:hypothetical protein